MTACGTCGAALETPLGCESCGALFSVEGAPTPFEVLGLEPAYHVDARELRRRFLRFSRLTHPDYFAGRPEESTAEHNTALLNQAHRQLADDTTRADWLVQSLGGPDEREERSMPQTFLMEVMEWNETLDDARAAAPGSAEREALAPLLDELAQRRTTALEAIAALLEPLPRSGAPALKEARQQLNAIRYLDRALQQLEQLRLDGAANR